MSKRSILLSVVACLIWGPLGLAGKAHAADDNIDLASTRIDKGFIEAMEGGPTRQAEVPLPESTQSGVTIAHGLDLGQLSSSEFNRLPITETLKEKLRPYVGLRRFNAVAFLRAHPLTISSQELQELDLADANLVLQPLVRQYDRTSPRPFLSLPPEAQTVIFSYAYQYGSGFMWQSGSKKIWYDFVTQNWSAASHDLRQSRLYILRRNSEARLLQQIA